MKEAQVRPFPSFVRFSSAMAREKNPGLKILWVWTLGTAAILVTSVARMRMRDMETIINSDQQQSQPQQTFPTDSLPNGEGVIRDDTSQV
ncbi:uncharacterized protein LOC111018274 [Momordica charantia]|uniref:Uncharacterized protein LOC111018274 n=1 Tax=Momordica charantia TaxID=3673 RepID=A0A6J1D892_MOMCH|nr:uncharacterized protein LOC111018274 [Momordica charantia]